MKIADYIILNRKNIFNVTQIIFTAIFTLLLLLLLNFRFNFVNYLNKSEITNPWFRVIVVGANLDKKNNGLDELKTIKNIELIYSSQYDFASLESSYKNEIYDGYVELNYGDKSLLPKNIIGNYFKETDSGVAICPSNFFPSSDAYNLNADFKFLDANNLIGTSFDVNYYSYSESNNKYIPDKTYSKTFKIIGLYNNEDLMLPSNNCFISPKDMIEIIDTGTVINDGVYGFTLVVDDIENVKKVQTDLEKLKFNYSIKIEYDTTLLKNIVNITNAVIISIVIIMLLININFLKKNIIRNYNDIGILFTIGYSTKFVSLTYLIQLLAYNIISYTVAIILSMLSLNIIKMTFKKVMLSLAYTIVYNYFTLVIAFCLVVIVPSIYYFVYTYKLVNKNIINLVKSEE